MREFSIGGSAKPESGLGGLDAASSIPAEKCLGKEEEAAAIESRWAARGTESRSMLWEKGTFGKENLFL